MHSVWRSCSVSFFLEEGIKLIPCFRKLSAIPSITRENNFSIFTHLAIIRTREWYKAGCLPGEAGLLQVEKRNLKCKMDSAKCQINDLRGNCLGIERKENNQGPSNHPLPTPYDQLPVEEKIFITNMIELSEV
jgi:hypothetical protein